MYKNLKYYLSILSLSIILFFISIYQSLFIYDDFHWGLVFANAIDFLSGKLPYKEVFIHYGFLTTFIHALVVWISNYKMISLMIFTSLIYSLAIVQFFFLLKKIFKIEMASIIIFFLYILHPFPTYPWHNYIVFFFFITSLNLQFINRNLTNFISGIMLALCVLASEVFFILLLIILIVEYSLFANNRSRFFIKTIGIAIVMFIFFFILISKNLFNDWITHTKITNVILQGANLIEVFLFFLKNFPKLSIKNIFIEPYRIIGIVSILFSFLMILKSLKIKKKLNTKEEIFLLINISSIFFYYTMLHKDNLFRFATGPAIGVISIFYYIDKIKEVNIKKKLIFLFFLTIFFSYPFEKNDNGNKNYVRQNMKEDYFSSDNFELFKYQIWDAQIWNNLIKFKTHLIENKCKDNYYFANLSFNGFYYIIAKDLGYETFQKIPWYEDSKYGNSLYNTFDLNFFSVLESNLNKKNIILVAEENIENAIRYNEKIYYMHNYNNVKLPYNGRGKANIILFFPKSCI